MDGFTYNNIFETKGIEYLIIIGFLLMIIPFWILINRKVPAKAHVTNALGILTGSMLRIPFGLHFSRNHTWVHLEKSGIAQVGIDDFLLHVTGEVRPVSLKEAGSYIRKGELLTEIARNGRTLRIYSPVSGVIDNVNPLVLQSPSVMNEDPYGGGWLCRIRPGNWREDTSTYFKAEDAVSWVEAELGRLRDFLAGSVREYTTPMSPVILQDGGELTDRPLADLPEEVWQDFQRSFLDIKG